MGRSSKNRCFISPEVRSFTVSCSSSAGDGRVRLSDAMVHIISVFELLFTSDINCVFKEVLTSVTPILWDSRVGLFCRSICDPSYDDVDKVLHSQ